LPVYKRKKKAEKKRKEKQTGGGPASPCYPEELALGLNVNVVEGILVFNSSSDPQPGVATPSLLVNEL